MTDKITKDTPAQIVEIAESLNLTAAAFSKMISELSKESTAQLDAAAELLVECRAQQLGIASYQTARTELIRAACAASDIDELRGAVEKIKSACSGLAHFGLGKVLKRGKIQSVCDKA